MGFLLLRSLLYDELHDALSRNSIYGMWIFITMFAYKKLNIDHWRYILYEILFWCDEYLMKYKEK
jgi:hypothetical protein